jgi:hypothetical protein
MLRCEIGAVEAPARTIDEPRGESEVVTPASRIFVTSCATLFVAACAAGGPSGLPASSITTSSTTPAGQVPTRSDLDALDCRRINGRMQVRILQIRDRLGERQNPVYAALQSAMNVFQASNAPPTKLDRATQHDVAVLKAQNAALERKGCARFDLAQELQPHPVRHTPRPTIAAAKAPAQR